MKTDYQVTAPKRFNKAVNEIDLSDLSYNTNKGIYEGIISIDCQYNRRWVEWQGEHDSNDFRDVYGFVLVPDVDDWRGSYEHDETEFNNPNFKTIEL